jgi:NAD(P)-dependent dehydrogenase (short-subunit alcohol dehydrogenase family)
VEPVENPGLFDLTGQVALVTGAAGGLGQAIALTLAELGASVVLSAHEQSPIDALCQQMTDAGHRALAVAADLANEDAVTQLAQTAERWHDGVDTLVCCGGMEGHVG